MALFEINSTNKLTSEIIIRLLVLHFMHIYKNKKDLSGTFIIALNTPYKLQGATKMKGQYAVN